MAESTINIEVAYAFPGRQLIIPLAVVEGSTAEQAIIASDILESFAELDLNKLEIGIFGQNCKLDKVLTEGDRVELYRPLLCDPKQARRIRSGSV